MRKVGILHLSDIHINKESITTIDTIIQKLIKDINKVKANKGINIDLGTQYISCKGKMAVQDQRRKEKYANYFCHLTIQYNSIRCLVAYESVIPAT